MPLKADGDRIGPHLAWGMLAVCSVGFIEGIAALFQVGGIRDGAWLAPLFAAAVMVPLALPLGVAAFAIASAFGRVPDHGRELLRRWGLPVALSVAVLAAASARGARRYQDFSAGLQDGQFARDLAVFCVALASAALPWTALALAASLERVGSAVSVPARVRAVVRGAGEALAFAVVASLLVSFLARHEALLGALFALPYGCLLALALGALMRIGRGAAASARATRAALIGAVAAFTLTAVGLSALRGADAVVRLTLGPARVGALFERLADVDGDGHAGLFGGRDCAPFDRARGPLAIDAPGNGRDEDCSGGDARRVASRSAMRFVPLPAQLVARRSIVLIVVDALRADRFGLGAGASLTPVLDRLAARSLVFTEAFSQSPSTRVSFPSFLSGRDPERITWTRKQGWLQSSGAEPTLAELLRRHGYVTGLVVNGWIRQRLTQIQRGYDLVLNTREASGKPVPPSLADVSSTARAIEFIEHAQRKPQPFFLTLYYEGPHAPYADLTERGFAPRGSGPMARYDAEIRHVDQQIGRVLDHLSVQAETAGGAIVIVTGDHGEEFGEHRGSHHDRECYRESTHVPLIVHAPGIAPGRVRARVALTNLTPTVLALVGAAPPAGLDGRNLISPDPADYAKTADQPVSCVFFADKNPGGSLLQAVRDEHHLYVERFGRRPSELYDTAADRREQRNVIADPGRAALRARLQRQIRPLQIR
jgi:arylsulfatase A-like enzyme